MCLVSLLCCRVVRRLPFLFFFFFNDTATTEIYTLSLHDALPISPRWRNRPARRKKPPQPAASRSGRSSNRWCFSARGAADRKSTRLNSSHDQISYAVFCLKKKKKNALPTFQVSA